MLSKINQRSNNVQGSEDFVGAVTAELREQGRSFDSRRFFCDEDELFHIDGKTYALSNQWGGQQALDSVEASIAKYGTGAVTYQPSTTE